jgi:hypothetical protein
MELPINATLTTPDDGGWIICPYYPSPINDTKARDILRSLISQNIPHPNLKVEG